MNQPLPIPDACALAMDAVLADPLNPGAEAESHLQTCHACSETRLAYLAQEEFPEVLAPTGYFEKLPSRVLRKLPARSSLPGRVRPLVWASAAALLISVGAGAFWVGRANRTPYVEATLPHQPDITETTVAVPDTPFHDRDEDAAQIQALTPEEMKALLKHLDAPPSSPR